MTLMVRHPGETALHPATAEEVIRPVHRGASAATAEGASTTH
jgi:hypothetical protein